MQAPLAGHDRQHSGNLQQRVVQTVIEAGRLDELRERQPVFGELLHGQAA